MTTLETIVDLINTQLSELTIDNPILTAPQATGRVNGFSLSNQNRQKIFDRTIQNAWVDANLKKTFSQNTTDFTNFFSFQLSASDLTNQQVVDNGFTFSFTFGGRYVSPISFTVWNRITSMFSTSVVQSSQLASFYQLKINGTLTFQVSDLTLEQDPITKKYTFVQPSTETPKIYNVVWTDISIDFPTTTKIVHTVYQEPEPVVSTTLAKNLEIVIADFAPTISNTISSELTNYFKNIVLYTGDC